jgi:hypothetical protein
MPGRYSVTVAITVAVIENVGISNKLGTTCLKISVEILK